MPITADVLSFATPSPPRANGNGECFKVCPAALYSSNQRDVFNPKNFRPLRNGSGLAFQCGEERLSGVAGLLLGCGPTAIVRRVTLIVVDAIKRVTFRNRPHIREEVLKGVSPTVADGYAPSAVLIKAGIVGIVATSDHSTPAAKFERVGLTVGTHLVIAKASTRPGIATPQRPTYNLPARTAITFAKPRNIARLSLSSLADNSPPSELITSQVFEVGASVHRSILSQNPVFMGG